MAARPRQPIHLSLAELHDWLATGRAYDDLGAATGAPLAVVHGDGLAADDPRLAAAAAASRSLPCVLLAGPADAGLLAPVVDAVADGDDAEAIAAQVGATPLAAAALVLLLRAAPSRSIDEGLVAESTTYSMLQGGPEFQGWRAARPVGRRAEPPGPAVVVERHGDVVHVVLNRPHVHNALDARVRDGLVEALLAAGADPDATVVLRGRGRSFCSGGDLDTFGSFPDPASAHALRLARSPARLLAGLAGRAEVRLHGSCLGAGIELSAFAGRVVADPAARLGLPELGLGLVPGAGGTVSLPRRIGRHRTAWLALRGGTIDAATALAWGLVDAVVPLGADGTAG